MAAGAQDCGRGFHAPAEQRYARGILSRTVRGALRGGLSFALRFVAAHGFAADPPKTLRVACQRRNELRSAVLRGCGFRRHHRPHLRFDARLRLPRAASAAGAAHARGDAYGRGRRRDVRLSLKRGIFFTPDPAFKGKPRELTAADQAYALKRLLDPAVKSPWLWLLEGKVVGADELRAQGDQPGSSTTTRRLRASRWSIATRCAFA